MRLDEELPEGRDVTHPFGLLPPPLADIFLDQGHHGRILAAFVIRLGLPVLFVVIVDEIGHELAEIGAGHCSALDLRQRRSIKAHTGIAETILQVLHLRVHCTAGTSRRCEAGEGDVGRLVKRRATPSAAHAAAPLSSAARARCGVSLLGGKLTTADLRSRLRSISTNQCLHSEGHHEAQQAAHLRRQRCLVGAGSSAVSVARPESGPRTRSPAPMTDRRLVSEEMAQIYKLRLHYNKLRLHHIYTKVRIITRRRQDDSRSTCTL